MPAGDLVICESTYGGRTHDTVEGMAAKLSDVVRRTVARGGKVLIPAFSLGRVQLVVHFIHQGMQNGSLPPVPIFVDSPLPANVAGDLKTLMAAVVSSGTAAGLFPGMTGVYAKTGTAEVTGQPDNSWFIAFHGDYAVCALAVKGGFGAATAGPEVASFLKAVPQ